jgi:IS30 family transposase
MGTQKKKYLQLTYEDRRLISHWKARGLGVNQIALRVGVHKSTVSRELKRNGKVSTVESQLFWREVSLAEYPREQVEHYLEQLRPRLNENSAWTALEAQRVREMRLLASQSLRRRKSIMTRAWVTRKLKAHWSPKQIAGRSKLEAPEPVSHEFVYQLIYRDRKKGGTLFRLLKRFRKRKQRFNSREYPAGSRIPGRVSIEKRPAAAERRTRLGDLEGDLIQGYCHSGYVLSVIDRKSRYVVLRKLKSKHKRLVLVQLERALRKLKHAQTLTLDNGTEFTDHAKLTQRTGVPVYFAHPYCSTDKGSIENANGLVRYYLPKKTCFKSLTQSKLNEIEGLLNHRPRECLAYLTPHEVHSNSASKISSLSKVLHL